MVPTGQGQPKIPEMDPFLQGLVARHGVFLRREALAIGYDDKSVAALLRHREWARVRHGAYTFGTTWDAADELERHRILSMAVMRSLSGHAALSHVSALVAHGIAVWGADLTKVHLTRLDTGAGRRTSDSVHHEGLATDDDVVEIGGLLVTRPARAVVEATAQLSVEAAVVSADSALNRGLTDPDELSCTHAAMQRWPFIQRTHAVLAFADGRAESPGESRSRYLFVSRGLPMPTLQHEVYDAWGTLLGVTDFAWLGHHVLGEFDGRVKYGRLLRAGEDAGDAVFREKKREDLIREATNMRMFRMTWSDLHHSAQTASRLHRLLGRRAA